MSDVRGQIYDPCIKHIKGDDVHDCVDNHGNGHWS